MQAGTLRHRVTLQRFEQGQDAYGGVLQDAYGGPVETWADVATCWAAVDALSGREFFATRQVQSEVSHKITLRHRSGVTPEMRVLFGGKVFGIEAVLPDSKSTRLVLMCKEASHEQD